MVGPGNHEVEQQPGSKELYVPYEHRYRMPWVRSTGPPHWLFKQNSVQNYKEHTTSRVRAWMVQESHQLG